MKNQSLEIPVYSIDKYYNTSEPYEWLYQFKNDKFLLRQLCEKMKSQAGAIGVKAFMGLWNAYCESMAQQQGMRLENATNFDGQKIELFSGEYTCDEYGVIIHDRYGYEQVICRHPIMPIQRLINIDSGEERLNIAFKKGRAWRNVIAEKTMIASSHSILNLAANGIMVNSENAKALSTYLLDIENMNYDEIPEQRSVGRLGWVGDHGFSPYVDNLEFDGENNFKHIFNAVKSHGDRQAWIDTMLKIRDEKSISRFALAASFASAIIEPCGILSFFVHFWGGQGTGKTCSLMVAASVWANPKMGEYIRTFNSTDVGMEMTASFLNSLPFCLDELQIQASAGIKEFDRMIYKLAEGVGKTRGSKSGGLRKTTTWRNCMITTGEYPIINSNSMGGASARVIEIECAEKVYSDLVGLCDAIGENYGFAGREFVEWLQKDENADKVNRLQKEYYRELLKIDSIDKQAASVSAILAADHIVTELIFRDGNNLTVEDVSQIMTKRNDVDVNVRAYDFIFDLIVKNINKFVPNEFGNYQGEIWGKIDGDNFYIIKSTFDKEMTNAGFNPTSFLSWAKRQGRLCTDSQRRTRRTRIAGMLSNCVCIIAENVEIPSGFMECAQDEVPF